MFEQLLRQVATPIAQQAADAAGAQFHSLIAKTALILTAVLLGAIGVGWLSWAGFEGLARDIDDVWAGVIVAAALFLLAGLASLFTTKRRTRAKQQPRHENRQDPELAEAFAVAEQIMREKSGSAAMMALVAGLAAGMMSGDNKR